MFTTLGPAPSKSGHAYSFVKCDACGAEKTARNSLLKANRVACSCGGVAPVQDQATPTGRPEPKPVVLQLPAAPFSADIIEQMANEARGPAVHRVPVAGGRDYPHLIAPLPGRHLSAEALAQMNFAALEERITAALLRFDKEIAQQATDFAVWREETEARMRALEELVGQPLKPGLGPAIKGTITEARRKLTYRAVVHGMSGAAKDEALWVSHRRGAELADTPADKRDAELFAELLDRFEIITEQLDTCTDKLLYAQLQPYMAKMNRSLNCWASENYDPTDYPITETP